MSHWKLSKSEATPSSRGPCRRSRSSLSSYSRHAYEQSVAVRASFL